MQRRCWSRVRRQISAFPAQTQLRRRLQRFSAWRLRTLWKKIAVVQCAGTCEATSVKADYRGIPSCAAAKLFYGGNGSCIFGCMGFGDCVKACPQGAISMQDGIACVNHTACIGCGICAQTCPQKIIEIVPDIIRTEVLCSSYHNGPYTKKVCSSGCIGCHKCEKTCPQGAITVDNFLARIDWNKCTACGACASVARPAQWSTAISPARPESSRSKDLRRILKTNQVRRPESRPPLLCIKTRRASVARGSKRMRNLVIPAGRA